MSESSRVPRTARRALIVFALVVPFFTPLAATAQDLFSRSAESDLLLRDLRRLRGLQVTVEVRFLTVGDNFLEQVGVDLGGSVSGSVDRRDEPVSGAKVILEAFQVRTTGTPGVRAVVRVGREVVTTDSSGNYSAPLRRLVPAEVRRAIEAGEVDALIFEATGKNGRRMDHLSLKAETTNGGLIQ